MNKRLLIAALGTAALASPAVAGAADYGPNTCLNGYVWREARASDLVCVTPSIRTQAKADNAAAPSRRNALNVSLSRSNGKYVVNASGVNNGTATVGLYWADTKRTITTLKAGVSGNRFSLNTGKPAGCSGSANAYFRVFDPSSGRSSARLPITYCVPID